MLEDDGRFIRIIGGIMLKRGKSYLKFVGTTAILIFSVMWASAVPVGCRMTEEGVSILSGEADSPKIVSYALENSSELMLNFSKKVELKDLEVTSKDKSESIGANVSETSDDGASLKVKLSSPSKVGVNYSLTGVASDSQGNTVSFGLPFTGFNENPCRLILSEISSKHQSSKEVYKKAEFVELYVLSGGNTAGIEIVSGSDGEEKKYQFEPVDVKTGEYITVHFRTVDEGECVNETGENLALSTGNGSSDTARDLWVEGKETRISDNDVIVLRDVCRGKILDAVLFSSSEKNSWYYAEQKTLSQEAFESGVWKGGSGVEYAASADGITAVRTLCRLTVDDIIKQFNAGGENDDVIQAGKEDWAVVKKCSPGEKNILELYSPAE